jgi:DNA-directed RNA polymerase subunit M/transcription elongation factor TFIIS
MVKFCDKCNNLYSHEIDQDTGKIRYVCAICGNKNDVIDTCIVINELHTNVQDYPVSRNMVYDKTYRRTNKIPCPNPDCQKENSENSENSEIIMFQYNPTSLKTGYMCTTCKTYWKN